MTPQEILAMFAENPPGGPEEIPVLTVSALWEIAYQLAVQNELAAELAPLTVEEFGKASELYYKQPAYDSRWSPVFDAMDPRRQRFWLAQALKAS